MELVAVAAVAENNVIGRDGEIPWPSLPADRRQYRERVAGHPVILGRRTFESMLDDLPGRIQIVVSRSNPSYPIETVHVVSGVEEAVDQLDSLGATVGYVLGGAAIYRLFLPHLDRMVLSRVPYSPEGDTSFPEWNSEEWTCVRTETREGFTLEEWVRRTDSAGS